MKNEDGGPGADNPDALERVRTTCLAFPEAHEVEAWGAPTFRVKNKMFATFASAEGQYGQGRPAIWFKAAPGEQDLRIRLDPDRYFSPPYVGVKGWIGMSLDDVDDWTVVHELLEDAYRLIAPKSLRAKLD